ncbi:hypothetical protein GCM10010992_13760 [Cloacibacterium rupense]|uniref:Uncharacterized protein n=1 Tax=Cloacibacterium rupense TaxID=517423 RepID=A0ABQ2NJT8_9FLAO|nr:hypothetical protein [Cloacibacterium rupense]GGP03837.1 hypothetical protein GCM10010992_13760 [Cloacibacterium rupense]
MNWGNSPSPFKVFRKIFGGIYIQGDSCNILTENILIPGGIVLTQKLKPMVTIINYKERQKEDGTSFYVLEVQGGIEMVKSQKTVNFYATAKKAPKPSQ